MTSENGLTLGQDERDSSSTTGITSTSYQVVNAVAEKSGKSASELEPLYYSINPDALNSIFSGPDSQTIDQLQFAYSGYQITVNGDGSVNVATTEE